jgi:hypothetical protein
VNSSAVILSLLLAQAPSPEWDWEKVYPKFEEAEEQYLLWTSHLHRLKELRPAWGELGGKQWDLWENNTREIMQLWQLVMEARKNSAAGRRWFRATETALMNMKMIMGEEAFHAGRIPRMPPGLYKPFVPVPAAPPVRVAGALRN